MFFKDKESQLLAQAKERLESLQAQKPLHEGSSIKEMLQRNGISRRDFLKWASTMTAAMALPASFAPLTAKAAEVADRLPLVWLHMAECTGCSESLLRSDGPSIDSLIFDYVSLEYHETIMAASGWQAEQNLESALERHKGNYILLVEGGIPSGGTENCLTIGALGHTGAHNCKVAAANAKAIFAIGSCSSFGGIQAAAPNPTQARPLHKIINQPVINVPGCPPSEKNIVGTLLHFILFGTLPPTDAYRRPLWAYGQRIHDLCERRGRFDAGEFVQKFGDAGAEAGYCLYKVGCKGPYTFNNCSKLRFNSHTSWPIQAGHGCIGCSEPNFWDNMGPFEEPVANHRFRPPLGATGMDNMADKVGITVLSAAVIGIAAHAVLSTIIKDKH